MCSARFFKCPNSYCIPKRHECNGIWNCPGGPDERHCVNRMCSGRFKCHNSSICIAQDSICDGIFDCIFKDDDIFCSLPICPTNCVCLLYSISCQNNITQFHHHKIYPYVVVVISISWKEKLTDILKQFHKAVVLVLSNKLQYPCQKEDSVLAKGNIINYLDISHNLIKYLQRNCFRSMPRLHYLNLSYNSIETLVKYSFNNETNAKLQFLDISFNQIRTLLSKSLYRLKLLTLILINNNIIRISQDSMEGCFMKNIIVDNNKICCLQQEECYATQNVHCHYTIVNSKALLVMLIAGFSGMVLGISVIVVNTLNIRGLSSFNYRATITTVAIGDILCSAFLLIISLADIIYGSAYFEYEFLWRESFLCFICACLHISHDLIAHFSISILAFSRLQIAKYPFDSKFVEKNAPSFVLRLLLSINGFSCLLSLIIIIIYWLLSHRVQSGLCILLGNVEQSVFTLALTLGTITSNIISLFLVTLLNLMLHFSLKKTPFDTSKHQQTRPNVKLFNSSLANHVYWVTSSSILLVIIARTTDVHRLLMWLVALVLPLNTLTNPFIFTYGKFMYVGCCRER